MKDLSRYLKEEYNLYKSKCLALNLPIEPLIFDNYKYELDKYDRLTLVGFEDWSLVPQDLVIDDVFEVFNIDFKSSPIKSLNSIIINHPISFGKKTKFSEVNINYVEMNKVGYITLPLFYNSGIKEFHSEELRGLGAGVFENSKLERIYAPNLTSISGKTFKECNLEEAIFPNLRNISVDGFSSCKNLKKVTLADDTSLAVFLFYQCDNLKYFNGAVYTDICPGNCFSLSGLEEIDMRNVTEILCGAFYRSKLRKIILSNKLVFVDYSAFEDVKNLEIDFYGSKEEFDNIKVNQFNDSFLNAKVNFLGNK